MRKHECIAIDCRKEQENIPYNSWVPIIRLGALKKIHPLSLTEIVSLK
jgi:hypothetical protein